MREMHLFAGAGGGILGGMLLGHTPVCAVEIDEFCREVLKQRQKDGFLPEFPVYGDIKEFDGNPWRGKVDVVTGGFPCQDISAAGKGAGIHGERSSLFFELARVVREVRPRYVFLENSPMLVGRGLDTVLGTLAELGYDAAWGVISAADCGANHLRKRIWVLADATGEGSQGHGKERGLGESCREMQACGCRQDVADRVGPGLERHAGDGKDLDGQGRLFAEQERPACQSGVCRGRCSAESGVAESGLGRVVDGMASRMDCDYMERPDWWQEEPEIPRVTTGKSGRVQRLKALGNGQVPRVAAVAWVTLERILRSQGE